MSHDSIHSVMTQKSVQVTQQIEILTKMSDGEEHLRHDFQSTKKKFDTKWNRVNEIDGFSHSTLHKRWNELLEEGSIIKTHSGKSTKRGDEKICGQITFFGFVKLLSSSKQNSENIDEVIEKFLPLMKDSIPQMIKKFSKKTISEIFNTVCKNIKIRYYKKVTESTIPFTSDLMRKQWASAYELTIKVKIQSSYLTFSKIIYLSGDDRKKQTIVKEITHATTKMQELFIGYFIYELIIRYVRFDDTGHYENYPADIVSIFQDNSFLLKLQKDFLDTIKTKISLENKALEECMSLIDLYN